MAPPVHQRQIQLFLLGALPLVLGSLASPSGDVTASAGYTLARLAPALGYASVRARVVQACLKLL